MQQAGNAFDGADMQALSVNKHNLLLSTPAERDWNQSLRDSFSLGSVLGRVFGHDQL